MANVTVIGAQWGDEGKGKLVDWLSNRADVVVRFQGGHNAGHTLVVEGKTYKLSLLPSGVVQGKLSVIGNGVVVDPWHLLSEIEKIASRVMILLDGRLLTADALKEGSDVLMLRLTADAPEATIRDALGGIAGIRSIAGDPDAVAGHFLLEVERRPSLAADVVAALVGRGVAVSEFAEIPPDLERVFLDLTRRLPKEGTVQASPPGSKEAA